MLRFKGIAFFVFTIVSMNCFAAPLNDFLETPDAKKELDSIIRLPETLNNVTLLHLGKNSLVARKKLIAEAKSYIFVDVPFWVHDDDGTELLEEMLHKTKESKGFEFNVIQDWSGPYLSNGGKQIKYDLGNHVMMWNSPQWNRSFSAEIKENHLHDKLFIVDGQKMILGGMNMADEYLEGGKTDKGWHDTDILLEGPVVQQGTETFLKLWQVGHYLANPENRFPPFDKEKYAALNGFFYNNIEDQNFTDRDLQTDEQITYPVHIPINDLLKNPKYFPSQPAVTDGVPVRLIYDNPLFEHTSLDGNHFSKMFQTVHFMIEHAQKSAWFYFPYFTPDKAFFNEIVLAAKKLDVRIITNSYSSWDMSKSGYVDQLSHYPDLLKAGVKIYEWQGHAKLKVLSAHGFRVRVWPGNTMHSKIALFDGSVAFVGSNNMNHQSFKNSNEVMAMINDEAFAQEIQNIFYHDMNDMAVIEPSENGEEAPATPLVQVIDDSKSTELIQKYKASDVPVWSYPLGL